MIAIGQTVARVEGPLEHLAACHRRIEERLATLERAAEHLAGPRRQEALEAIEACLRFFATSGALHTADEEESLFPRLRARLEPGELVQIASLEHQHQEAIRLHAELEDAVREVDVRRYRGVVFRLAELYRSHIAFEDETLLELSRRLLSADDLAEMAAEMKGRRR